MFNGERPELAQAPARRAIDTTALWKETFEEERVLDEKLQEESGYTWNEYYFKTKGRNLNVAVVEYVPGEETEVGVIFCHGYGNSLRWNTRRNFLEYAKNGYFVAGMEMEGHGFTDGTLCYIKDFSKVVNDFDEFVHATIEKKPEIKSWFLHAESLGGLLALSEVLKLRDNDEKIFSAMVLMAPLCKMDPNVKPPSGFAKAFTALIAMTAPSLSIVPAKPINEQSYKRAEVLERVKKDPVKYIGKPRVGTILAIAKQTIEVNKRLNEVNVPLMILHGKADSVATPLGSEELFEKADVAPEDKMLVMPEEGWHALLYGEAEEELEEYWNQIRAFVDSKK